MEVIDWEDLVGYDPEEDLETCGHSGELVPCSYCGIFECPECRKECEKLQEMENK